MDLENPRATAPSVYDLGVQSNARAGRPASKHPIQWEIHC